MKYILIILVLYSCSTPEKLVNKALSKDRAKVAEITRSEFPCTDIKADTVTVTDSLYEFVECPENDFVLRTDTVKINGKTVYVPITKTIRTPVKVARETKYVTIKVEDSAKIFLMATEDKKLRSIIREQESKIEKKNKWIRNLLIALIVSLGLNYIQFRKR